MNVSYAWSRLGKAGLAAFCKPRHAMTDELTPDSLRPGCRIGPWRLEGYGGRGTYGMVFRARRAGHPSAEPVALKLAVFPYDPRFLREVELLRRVRHPGMPQLLDQGWWQAGPEAAHPYVVMEWIRGQPLYDWARKHHPTQRQVLRVVAQVAWVLDGVHRAECLHRDVRGDNILVEPEGRAVLTDFGSGTWRGAPPLTERVMPPNTREYRSPEALRFEWGNWRKKGARYEAGPADDLYALGVAAYRLVTGGYPPPGTDPEALKENLPEGAARRPTARELNPRVVPELSALIERMLAEEPEARGSVREVAEAAESEAEHLGPEVDVAPWGLERAEAKGVAVPAGIQPEPSAAPAAAVPSAGVPVAEHTEREARPWEWRPVFVVTTVSLMLVATCWMAPDSSPAPPEVAQVEEPEREMAPDAGTRGLGDEALATRVEAFSVPNSGEPVAENIPKQPLPGQRRPPCKKSWEVVINGGCWKLLAGSAPPCGEGEYEWQGACYDPALDRSRPPTSTKPQ
jgi:eukaryotic-like serine/threonine-protein kinase